MRLRYLVNKQPAKAKKKELTIHVVSEPLLFANIQLNLGNLSSLRPEFLLYQ